MATTFSVGELSWMACVDAKHGARHHDFQCLLHINNILNGTKHHLSASSSVFPRLPAKLRPPPLIHCHALGLLFPNCHQRKFTFYQNPTLSWRMIGRLIFDLTLNRSLPFIFSLVISSTCNNTRQYFWPPTRGVSTGLPLIIQNPFQSCKSYP